MPRQKPTETERAQRRQADRDRLEQAARALLSTAGWHQWVRVRSTNGLRRYSLANQLLIALQYPEATYVAGFRAFLKLNRCVRKGERAIRILAPVTRRTSDSDEPTEDKATVIDQRVTGDERTAVERRLTGFRTVAVFDVSQTDPLPGREPLPLTPPAQSIHGDTHRNLLPALARVADQLGYSVELRPLAGPADGWCDHAAKQIVVNSRLSPNGQVRVLVHEIAHALGIRKAEFGTRNAEVLVDTVTYIVCGSLGLDTAAATTPYIAAWGEDDQLAAIRDYAATIDATARQIEDAIATQQAGLERDGWPSFPSGASRDRPCGPCLPCPAPAAPDTGRSC